MKKAASVNWQCLVVPTLLAVVTFAPLAVAAQGTLFVVDDKVGVGTDDPEATLHVEGSLTVEDSTTHARLSFVAGANEWEIGQNFNTGRLVFFSPGGGAITGPFKFDRSATENLFRVGVMGPSIVDINGSLVINGTDVTPDYVFEADYPLLSIEEQADFMWSNKHLPSMTSGSENEAHGVDMLRHQYGMLEELEKAHIYIVQLNEAVKELRAEVVRLREQAE